MTIGSLPQGFLFSPAGKKPDAPAAAREFEALLIASLLKTAREAGAVLADPSSETGAEGYLELAEEHIARSMAQSECFGIARIILKNLEKAQASFPAGDGAASGGGKPTGG